MQIKIKKTRLDECHLLDGLVVVIDVIRAFTTSAYAFAAGMEKMILVGTVEEAFQLHQQMADTTLLAGESEGLPITGFHFDNSPFQMSMANLSGKTLIFRTSSGTQGVVKATNAERILTASFSNAEATLRRIKTLAPKKVSFVSTGQKHGGLEDDALADYLESKILHGQTDPAPYLERVFNSPLGQLYANNKFHRRSEDMIGVMAIDKFDFAQEVSLENGLHVLRRVQ